jgi:hypothetical protein
VIVQLEFSISVLLFAFGLIVSSTFVTSSVYAYSAKQQQQQQPSDRTNDGIPFLFPMPSISLDDNITTPTKTTPSSQHDKNKPLDANRLLETKPDQIQFKTILNSNADKNLLIDNSDNTTSLMRHNRVTTPQTLTVQGNKTTITSAAAPTTAGGGGNKTTATSAPTTTTPSAPPAPTTAGGGGGGNKTYSLNIGGKTYPIKYQITGNGNKLNNIIPQKDNATLLANIVSTSDGTLTIELPRNIIDSKKQGGIDDDYAASADGQDTTANEIKNTNQVRTLAIDFDKGTNQIEVTGDHIVPEFGSGSSAIAAAAIVFAVVTTIGILAAGTKYRRLFGFMPRGQ